MNLKNVKKLEKTRQNKKDEEIIIIDGKDAWPMPDFSDAPRLKKNV